MARRAEPRAAPADASEVVLDVELDDGVVYLVLANAGPVVARDVAVRFDRPLLGIGGEVDVAKLPIFQRLPLLRRGRDVRIPLDTASLLYAREEPRVFEAVVTWRDADGERRKDAFRHDLAIWRDVGEIARPG